MDARVKTGPRWPADSVEKWPLSKLLPYARNSRIHTDNQVAKIARNISEYGWTTPMLVAEDGTIISGHGRCLAAAKLGITTAPVMVARGWTEAQKNSYRIWDNQSTLLADWDFDALRIELAELKDVDFDLSLTGFDEGEVFKFSAVPPVGDPEVVPEPPKEPTSRAGDLWVLGGHRLLCGSSTDAEDVARVLGENKPHLMVTDPPYGVDYDPDWRNRADRANGKPYGASAIGVVSNDHRSDWRDAWKLFPGDVIYCWHPPGANSIEFYHGLDDSGFPIRMQIIWNKSNFPIGRGDYHVKHEPCWYAVKKGKKGHWSGDRKQTTVWDIPKPQKSETGHSTQKPIECMKRPMENNSKPGDWVYDPFMGSGTSIIAAETIQRRCIGIELDPSYVDVGVLRWQQFTGKEAVLYGTDKTFAQVSRERKKAAQGKPKGKR